MSVPQARPRSIAVLGGSFDPVHRGHLNLARAALDELGVDRLLVLPCHIPAHKQALQAADRQRLDMLSLAFADWQDTAIDLREMQQPRVSYSYDTLREIRAEIPQAASLIFLLGWDSWCSLETWHRWRELFDLVSFAIARRQMPCGTLSEALRSELEGRECDASRLCEFGHGRYAFLKTPEIHVSSTQIRERLKNGMDVDEWVPANVARYLKEHKIYA